MQRRARGLINPEQAGRDALPYGFRSTTCRSVQGFLSQYTDHMPPPRITAHSHACLIAHISVQSPDHPLLLQCFRSQKIATKHLVQKTGCQKDRNFILVETQMITRAAISSSQLTPQTQQCPGPDTGINSIRAWVIEGSGVVLVT